VKRPTVGVRGRAAWTLALLTTFCAELTFTAVAVPFAWLLLPVLLVMYGAGVLLLREAAVRVGGGSAAAGPPSSCSASPTSSSRTASGSKR
jgi:hypothetical protein